MKLVSRCSHGWSGPGRGGRRGQWQQQVRKVTTGRASGWWVDVDWMLDVWMLTGAGLDWVVGKGRGAGGSWSKLESSTKQSRAELGTVSLEA